MATPFVPGWHPDHARRALDRIAAAGVRLYAPAPLPKPTSPVALAAYRLRVLDQGQAGTCYTHGPTQAAETTGRALGLAVFALCRRLTAYEATRLAGGGNPADGGSGFDAFAAMSHAAGGVGVAPEDACPYSDDRRTLATRPPAAVYDAAKAHWLDAVVRVPDLDAVAGLIGAKHAVSIGTWWPDAWGRPDASTLTRVGGGSFGHEVCLDGYAPAGFFDAEEWFRVENSWNRIYQQVRQAPEIPGEDTAADGLTSGFWRPRSHLERVLSYGGDGSEIVTMTALGNFAPVVVVDVNGLEVPRGS